MVAARTFAPAQAEASATAATESAASASAAPTAIASANASTSEPDAGGRGRGEEGAGRAALGNGSHEGLGDDYLEKIRRWLSRYQKMPEEAAQKKQYGTAVVSITLDRAGNVLDAQIEKSSGYPLLDAATLQMVHDASPLPKVPETFKNNELEIAVPANYRPGFFESLFR